MKNAQESGMSKVFWISSGRSAYVVITTSPARSLASPTSVDAMSGP
jgi:hypothetical protein